jgi:hypothetical protein
MNRRALRAVHMRLAPDRDLSAINTRRGWRNLDSDQRSDLKLPWYISYQGRIPLECDTNFKLIFRDDRLQSES